MRCGCSTAGDVLAYQEDAGARMACSNGVMHDSNFLRPKASTLIIFAPQRDIGAIDHDVVRATATEPLDKGLKLAMLSLLLLCQLLNLLFKCRPVIF